MRSAVPRNKHWAAPTRPPRRALLPSVTAPSPAPVPRAYRVAQVGAALVVLGGTGDLLVPRLLPAHERYLGVAPGAAPAATSALVLLVLHALGVALAAVGLAALALLAAWRRTGDRGALWAAAGAVALAEGYNAWGIARVGSVLFVGPLLCAALVLGGAARIARDAGARG